MRKAYFAPHGNAAEGASSRALITGGAGFIGSHLADLLLSRGIEVTVIDNLSTGRKENIAHLQADGRFRFVEGCVRDTDLVDALARGCTQIYHLAAVVGVQKVLEDPLLVMEENVFGTRAVLEAARRTGAAVFIASTSEVYGKSESVPFHEDADRVLGPTSVARWGYSTSKAVDEILGFGFAARYGVPVVVGRFFNTIGQRQTGRYGMVVPRFVGQALEGRSITVYGTGEQTRSFTDVRDVIRAVTGLMDDPASHGRAYNIGSTREISILQLARTVLERLAPERLGQPDAILHVSYNRAYVTGYEETPRRVPDTTRIREQIGWVPRYSLDESLRWVADAHSGLMVA